jgi:hypothetical protein
MFLKRTPKHCNMPLNYISYTELQDVVSQFIFVQQVALCYDLV